MVKRIIFLFFIFLFFSSCGNTFTDDIKTGEIPDEPPEEYLLGRFTVSVSLPGNKKDRDLGVLILPESYSLEGDPARLVIYCHGGSGYVTMENSEAEQQDVVKYFVSQGLAVLSMMGMPEKYAGEIKVDECRNLGFPAALEAYQKGYDFVVEKYNINKTGCFLFSNSHGGLIASNIVNLTDIPVIAQSGASPLLSIAHNAWFVPTHSWGIHGEFSEYQIKANIIKLYNMTSPISSLDELKNAVYEKDKTGIYDPYDYLINQTALPYKTPYMILSSREDEIVYHFIAESFMGILNQRGSNITIEDAREWGAHNVPADPVYVGEFSYNGVTIGLRESYQKVYNFFISYDK
jgi:hypothetical protein